jgi:nucleotide-binding universal stress UspA family protein
MDSFQNVLAPIDFSTCSTAALAVAGNLARASNARLTLLHVYPRPYLAPGYRLRSPQVGLADDETKAELRRSLAQLSAPARTIVRNVEVALREGDPGEEILAYAGSGGVDLVVMGTHGRHGLDRLILGSVSERVAREASVSVLAVRDSGAGGRPWPSALSHLLCAVDLAELSYGTLDTAVGLARVTGARLSVLYVVDAWHWEDPWPLARGHQQEYVRALSASAYARLASALESFRRPGLQIDPLVAIGHPREEILGAAMQSRPDVLIVGAHSGHTIRRRMFGSTAQDILRAAPCPVLIARASKEGAAREADAVEAAQKA